MSEDENHPIPEELPPTGQEILEHNKDLLKSVNAKSTTEYDDKYVNGLFGINVELTEEEMNAVDALLVLASKHATNIMNSEPLWPLFQNILEQRRSKVGDLMEENAIIADPSATVVSKDLINDKVPAIRVPERLKNLYIWQNRIETTKETVEEVRKGLARGRSAKRFGETVKELYSFCKQLNKSSSDSNRAL